MKTVTLELQEMQSIRQLHQYLRRVLALPAYYGENLDALYDCLTGSQRACYTKNTAGSSRRFGIRLVWRTAAFGHGRMRQPLILIFK